MDTKISILCLDDKPENTKALSSLLSKNFEVYTTSSPFEALEIVKRVPELKVIISSQQMSEMDGFTVLKLIKILKPDTYRILISGYADARDLMQSHEKGVFHKFLTKPWSTYTLFSMLGEMTKNKSMIIN